MGDSLIYKPVESNAKIYQHLQFSTCENYEGLTFNNALHDKGTYTRVKENERCVYSGAFYANNFEGYAKVTSISLKDNKHLFQEGLMKPDTNSNTEERTENTTNNRVSAQDNIRASDTNSVTHFQGLFKENSKFGPGVFTHENGTQDVGLWLGCNLIRLARVVLPERVPSLGCSASGKENVLKYRRAIEVATKKNVPFFSEHNNLFERLGSKYIRNRNSKFYEKDDSLLNNGSNKLSHLIAWNDNELMVEIFQHSYLHENREHFVDIDIEAILLRNRNYFNEAGVQEMVCIDFLKACSHGDLQTLKRLKKFINPDLSDGNGNSGIVFAASSDRIGVIKTLAEFGGDLDWSNDDGLTALNICLLRCFAVDNWEKAFLLNPQENLSELLEKMVSLNSHEESSDSIRNYCWRINLTSQDNNDDVPSIIGDTFNENSEWLTRDIRELFRFLRLNVNDNNKSQANFNYDPHTHQEYLLNPRKAKAKVKINESVFNTIAILLHFGADPNLSVNPLPALILSLFLGDVNLVETLLKHGADANLQHGKEKLTALHFLALMPVSAIVSQLWEVLLRNGADKSLRCFLPDDKKKGAKGKKKGREKNSKNDGDKNEVETVEGKTALHVLCKRNNFTEKNLQYLKAIASNFTASDYSDKYSKRTPLQLVILDGNYILLEAILQSKYGDSPPNLLEYDERNLNDCLSLYVKKENVQKLPNLKRCKKVIDSLLKYGANPLGGIEANRNLNESILNEKPKGKKVGAIIALYKHVTKKLLLQYCANKAFISSLANDFNQTLLKFLKQGDLALRKKLFFLLDTYKEEINFNGFDSNEFSGILKAVGFLIVKLEKLRANLETCERDRLHKVGSVSPRSKAKNKTHASNKLDTINNVINKLKALQRYFRLINEDDYIVCFKCGLKTGKNLLPCPKCGLVYFCSQVCNKAKNVGHPCMQTFYNQLAVPVSEKLQEINNTTKEMGKGNELETFVGVKGKQSSYTVKKKVGKRSLSVSRKCVDLKMRRVNENVEKSQAQVFNENLKTYQNVKMNQQQISSDNFPKNQLEMYKRACDIITKTNDTNARLLKLKEEIQLIHDKTTDEERMLLCSNLLVSLKGGELYYKIPGCGNELLSYTTT